MTTSAMIRKILSVRAQPRTLRQSRRPFGFASGNGLAATLSAIGTTGQRPAQKSNFLLPLTGL
jgi:hypothetical protein